MNDRLSNERIRERNIICWGCPAAKRVKSKLWGERILYCGEKLKGTEALQGKDRHAARYAAYLPVFGERPGSSCPRGLWGPAEDLRKPSDPLYQATVFHILWAEIHDPARHWTPEWWQSVLDRLVGVPCECRKHAIAYVDAHPIPFGDDVACWEWAVVFHDVINMRKGRPVFGLERAREWWSASSSLPMASD